MSSFNEYINKLYDKIPVSAFIYESRRSGEIIKSWAFIRIKLVIRIFSFWWINWNMNCLQYELIIE